MPLFALLLMSQDNPTLFEAISAYLLLYGTAANKPLATDVPLNATYFETDTGELYQNQNATWVLIAVNSGGSTSPGGSDKNIQYNNAGAFGGISNNATATNKFLRQVSSGTPTLEQIDGADLVAASVGPTQLANTAATPGTFGDTDNSPVITIDAQGRITASSEAAIDKTRAWQHIETWTWSTNVTEVVMDNLPVLQDILLVGVGITKSVSTTLHVVFSDDNGANYFDTSGDYVIVAATGVPSNAANFQLHTTNATAARDFTFQANGFGAAVKKLLYGNGAQLPEYMPSTAVMNALKVFPTGGGNLTAGAIYLYGR